jgi:hypothetical protein
MSPNVPIPTPAEILAMKVFLARVVRITPAAIKITGDPATDENTDLLTAKVSEGFTHANLDKLKAVEILCFLEGWTDTLPDGSPDIARGAAMYAEFVAHPLQLYPPASSPND